MDYEKRTKALKVLKRLSLVQLVLVGLVLILGGVASSQHGQSMSGVPPYYLGVFIVGPMALLNAVIGMAICFRGKHCFNKTVAAQKTGCLMQSYCISLPFVWLGGFIAILIAAFTGICSTTDCSYLEHTGRNYRLAVTIVIIIIIICISGVVGLVLVCMYASHFGIRLFSRGQNRIANDIGHRETTQDAVYAANEHSITHFQLQDNLRDQQIHLETVQALRERYLQQSARLTNRPEPQHSDEVVQVSVVDPSLAQHGDSENERARPYVIESPPTTARTNQIDSIRRAQRVQRHNNPIASDHGRRILTAKRQGQREHRNKSDSVIRIPTAESQIESDHENIPHSQKSPRKKKRRRKVRPSHPNQSGPGTSYVLPPILNYGLPPPPPSPPPPPNTPPPPLSPRDEFVSSPPPLYYVNEYVNEYANEYVNEYANEYVNDYVDHTDPPPPYTP